MSRPPSASTVRATVRVMSSALNTSQVIASARPPRSVMVRAVAATLASVRPATATAAPAAASEKAMPCPTPCPAPVTSATLPLSSAVGGSCRGCHARQPVCGELRGLIERLDFLVDALVHRLGDAPLPLMLGVLIAVEGAAGGAHLLLEVDEDIGEIPDAGGARIGEHVDLRMVPRVAGNRIGVEGAGDRGEHLLAPLDLPAITAADVVDLHLLHEEVAHGGDVAHVHQAPVAVLEATDEFDIFQTKRHGDPLERMAADATCAIVQAAFAFQSTLSLSGYIAKTEYPAVTDALRYSLS